MPNSIKVAHPRRGKGNKTQMQKSIIPSVLALVALCAAGCPGVVDVTPDETTIFDTSAVVKWNEVALAAVRNGPPRPTVIARTLYIVHNAMYDAWAAYDDVANGTQWGGTLRRPASERTVENKTAAISYAAHRALLDQFPAYETNTGAFTRLLNDLGFDVSDSTDTTTPAGIGNVAAQAILDFRQDDGANEAGNYAQIMSETYPALYAPVNSPDDTSETGVGGDNFDPNKWQPLRVPTGKLLDADGNPTFDNADPTTYTDQGCLSPHWGAVIPFALTSGDQFRPGPPPLAGSDDPYTDALGQSLTNDAAYNQQVDEILNISANLTDREKVIAEYWADGPRSETPPGHWHALAHGVSSRDHHSLDDDVKLYFALGGALFDSAIAVWEAKREYDYVRPQSAIRHKYFGQRIMAWGGPNKGTVEMNGEEWRPYQSLTFVTPPFQEYTSGHSSFSAAAAEILTRFTGSNRFYDGETIVFDEDFNRDGLPDHLGEHIIGVGGNAFERSPSEVIVLQWPTFQDAAIEAALSRRYGGIHFQDGDLRSREMGRNIGEQAFVAAQQHWNGVR